MLMPGIAFFVLLHGGVYAAQIEPLAPMPLTENNILLDSEFSILIDANTGHIIHGVNEHERAYPASITKVMTALLLLESGYAMHEPIVHSHAAISSVMPWHSGLAYVDEFLTLEEALHAIMLASANDTSNAIAEFLGGTTENFAQMMTQRAHRLGATSTNFANSHGLWEDEHFTTAYDAALIMREALRHEQFRDIIATQRFVIPPSINYDEYRMIYNTNRMIFPTSMHFSPDIIGGKTGFTNNSRHTLASYGQRGDLALISVVMSADQRDMMYVDTRTLMDFGFEQFEAHAIFAAHSFEGTIDLVQRSGEGVLVIGNIDVYAESDVTLSLPRGFDANSVIARVHLPNRVVAPIPEGFAVGSISFEYDENVLAEVSLLTAKAGYQLSEQDLATLFPGGGAAEYVSYVASGENISTANLILNVSLAAIGAIVLAFVMLRFLQFSRRSRRRKSLGKYRGYRGYSGPYKTSTSMQDYKFKYRYK